MPDAMLKRLAEKTTFRSASIGIIPLNSIIYSAGKSGKEQNNPKSNGGNTLQPRTPSPAMAFGTLKRYQNQSLPVCRNPV